MSLLILLHLQSGGLTSACNISDHLMIHPLFTLGKNTSMICTKSLDGPLILHGVIEPAPLRIFRKGELGLHFISIIVRHGSGGKIRGKVLTKSALYLKGLMGPQP